MSLGSRAPNFRLPDALGGWVTLDDFAEARALVVMFICNHCPYVKHVRSELARLGRDYKGKAVSLVAINSNDAKQYPDDSPEKMAIEAREAGYTFPYLFDEDQSVARAYDAACTPDFFVFDGELRLVYRGQLDDSRPSNGIPVSGSDVRGALEAVLAGRPVSAAQHPSAGCNIKWKR